MVKMGLGRRQQGFTIIELVVTLVALGFFAVSIGTLFTNLTEEQHNTDLMAVASDAAETEIESLRNNGYSSLTAGTVNFSSSLPSVLPSNSTGSAVITKPSADIVRVDVTVTYYVGTKSHSVELSSLIARIGINS
jgi:prepilin-type N-terminal cleavage/methylation domain-containing protein